MYNKLDGYYVIFPYQVFFVHANLGDKFLFYRIVWVSIINYLYLEIILRVIVSKREKLFFKLLLDKTPGPSINLCYAYAN